MDKNKIMYDMDFRTKCTSYGLSWENFLVLDDMIIVNSPNNNLVAVFDQNYNTVGFLNKSDYKDAESYMMAVRELKNGYDNNTYLPYPFNNYSIKQIVELANRVSIHVTNHGHSADIIVNGEVLTNETNPDYAALISYIKFLGYQIEQYYMNLYHMKMIGFEYPNIYQYISRIITKIDECIYSYIRQEERPYPVDVIEYLGQDTERMEEYDLELYDIIDLLLKQKGYIINREDGAKLKKITDLRELTQDILNILEVPQKDTTTRK